MSGLERGGETVSLLKNEWLEGRETMQIAGCGARLMLD